MRIGWEQERLELQQELAQSKHVVAALRTKCAVYQAQLKEEAKTVDELLGEVQGLREKEQLCHEGHSRLVTENEALKEALEESQRLHGTCAWQLERHRERAEEDWKQLVALGNEKEELKKEVERLEDMELQQDRQLVDNIAMSTDMAKMREDLFKARSEAMRWEARALAAERERAAGK